MGLDMASAWGRNHGHSICIGMVDRDESMTERARIGTVS